MRHAPRHLQGVPTLTEVIDLPAPAPLAVAAALAPTTSAEPGEPAGSPADVAPVAGLQQVDEDELVARVLVELQHYVGLTLEDRMREAIEPALALAAETLVRELRSELAATLHAVVARSVSEELERQRRR